MSLENIELIAHSAIRLITNDSKVIYFDPFKLEKKYNKDADYIFITHPHYDHFSSEDISQIKKDNTSIIVVSELVEKCMDLGFDKNKIFTVEVDNNYTIDNISFNTTPAYNINKNYHKKEYNWIGYLLKIDDLIYYVAGDTDNIPELQNIKCDIAFVPVGGTYTMTYKEAAELIKKIAPKLAVPIHYKTIVGSYEDAMNFKKEAQGKTEVHILM